MGDGSFPAHAAVATTTNAIHQDMAAAFLMFDPVPSVERADNTVRLNARIKARSHSLMAVPPPPPPQCSACRENGLEGNT
jgi:hypothetical protein